MTRLLEVDGVVKSFGGIAAVDAVSIAVAEGEFFAVLGPSGCGKTTLLRMIAGFETPDRGAIRLDGRDLTGLKPNRRPINLMFQSYALFPHMTVARNVAYGLEAEGLRGAAVAERVDQALDQVRLRHLAGRKPAQLSGGERQRVALARALVKRPRLLLLDEPLAALDKKLRSDMQIELKHLQRETGVAFVVVTHDQEEALSMADRVCLLERGRVRQLGTPRDLYEAPATRFAADFIGRMNFLPCTVERGAAVVPGLGPLPAANAADLAEGGKGDLAIRPERMRVHGAAAAGRHPATVDGIAYLGHDAELRLALAGGLMLIARVPASHDLAGALAPGLLLWCDWAPTHARIIPADRSPT